MDGTLLPQLNDKLFLLGSFAIRSYLLSINATLMFAADRRLQDKDCYENNCALCHFPTRMNLSIRGLCSSDTKVSEGYFDRFYFIQGYISDNPHWRGFGKSHIYYRPRRQVWRLESFYDLERYAEFFADDSNPYSKFENNIL